MIKTMVNAWKIADLRKKIIYTAFILFLFRLGCAIPVPFINIVSEQGLVGDNTGTFLNYLSMMTGEAFNYGRVFALGITPYINSSIILQLLAVAIPALEKLSHDEEGRKKMAAITRYVTVALAILQGIAYYVYIWSQGMLTPDANGVKYTGFGAFFQGLVIVCVLTAGSALVMWLGEQINEKGIGNGISLILFAGIVSRIPAILTQMFDAVYRMGKWYYLIAPLALIGLLAMIVYICFMDGGERRIPVQYAKRVVGRKMYGGQSSNIPIKVNMSGVLPVIFASSILSLPPTVEMFIQDKITDGSFWQTFFGWFKADSWVYGVIYFLLIIFFAYFYSSIQYNPVEMANNLAKNSGMIPGIRSGKPTAEYIAKIISKMVLLGALMLSVCALFPVIFSQITTAVGYGDIDVSIGGTSIIILVGVALETVSQIESQMMMRHYKGFLD
ncbi:MAG: preprotein translocase subunit SecY [Ruminococcaceae bacterium]|nr:preprotein translocase subunit SecY [Oscillospiraceae bacterium]MBR3596944.1 preprotein translocase subunit SecY [Clostridia bacterium]